jgi:hypothetical protein
MDFFEWIAGAVPTMGGIGVSYKHLLSSLNFSEFVAP